MLAAADRLSGARRAFWSGIDVLDARAEKSACALAALAETLESRRPLGGGEAEFLALYRGVRAAGADAFTRAWTDPTAYWWVRLAYQLAATVIRGAPLPPLPRRYVGAIGADGPARALALHLARFRAFALSVALLDGRDLALAAPLEAEAPFHLPGTGILLAGSGRVAVASAREGAPRDASGRPLETARCASVPFSGREGALLLDASTFLLPAFEFDVPSEARAPSYQAARADLTARTLALVARHAPEVHEQMAAALRVVAWKPRRAGTYTNATHSDLPGAFICGLVDEPYEMADTFVHEFLHGRLFALEEEGPFLDAAVHEADAYAHYSPWRRDPRNFHGILHGLYVFAATARYWIAVFRSGEASGDLAALARDRVVRYPLQVAIAARQLGARAPFTEHGRRLFEVLEDDVARIAEEARAAGAPEDAPAFGVNDDGSIVRETSETTGRPVGARESVAEHLRRHDARRECAEMIGALGLPA
jgi:HEXXH motif-containing protein